MSDFLTWLSKWALFVTYPTFLVPFCTWCFMDCCKTIPRELEACATIAGESRILPPESRGRGRGRRGNGAAEGVPGQFAGGGEVAVLGWRGVSDVYMIAR